jgi:hypothetical protein
MTETKTSWEMRYWATTRRPSWTPSLRGDPRRATMEVIVKAMNGGNGTKVKKGWARL